MEPIMEVTYFKERRDYMKVQAYTKDGPILIDIITREEKVLDSIDKATTFQELKDALKVYFSA